ncbi:aldehyde dehydrogenase family protein [Caulobacter segnis]|uniref:aldehyde dehydrogenase (NAD(+)) n=2 Tax=Caulobacter segnis TaxID=88688 RepID=D5VKU5_CAUST|nr:aldehyde dehydrogenase family protein [Caulobacter segnis]ADG11118.1 Aldehyde Dehydrogenase [Caulobacter segnis ATCC 21756]AVQ02806.1 aldehyde dehydrogenase family protein [Caulobacter segnis]
MTQSFPTPAAHARDLLDTLGVPARPADAGQAVRSPIDGSILTHVAFDDAREIEAKVAAARRAFDAWRVVPAPRRGELVRLFGEELRAAKADLAALVTLEAGKIASEAAGEVQEMIDICDFAVGLSRQLHGLTIASERPGHAMRETWHPLGPVAVISAFNFPVAVWAWNACLALVCGDPVIWKPSEKTPLTALATHAILQRALARFGDAPEGLASVVQGGRDAGERLARDPRIPLVSATGSTRMGKALAPVVAERFGRSILELGGNNAMIVTPSADLSLALRAIVFSAAGTAGQRCTSLRRLIVHESLVDKVSDAVDTAFQRLPVGDPREGKTLLGPLIDRAAYEAFVAAMDAVRTEGGTVSGGERLLADQWPEAFYVRPALARLPAPAPCMQRETFAPLLHVVPYAEFDEAVAIQNDVPQGLSSCVMTNDVREAEAFLSAAGSDCGIANVNIGPSGAEIGGAFGGEKETGGGRESGSDSWKQYMRRQTATVNYSGALPLAQGVRFDL